LPAIEIVTASQFQWPERSQQRHQMSNEQRKHIIYQQGKQMMDDVLEHYTSTKM
jgi:hypothetical protein